MKNEKFAVRKGNLFLNGLDEFKSPALFHKDTARFDTKDAALDKAVALGLDLDNLKVHSLKISQEA